MFAALILLVLVVDTVITGYQLAAYKRLQADVTALQSNVASLASVARDVAEVQHGTDD